ncbi:putative uncharacterized protein DDB_G0280071 [Hibiscus syriacus]|uniref:putative uncharacterized protein DDB_G0280071 n=1 Tax=Hibiscus syriacus TaxID=106335 RepID=UPI001920515B|nr:putative uncharacterized protein DDB_G0280071 [Hibiscus syriacus]
MEGVLARFGRSSTRYGPATVFTGPVRKWKKKWVHVSPSNTGNSNNNNPSQNKNNNHHSTNGISNGNNGSHLVLFKWTPLSQSQNNYSSTNYSSMEDDVATPGEPPRRKFKYIPIAVLEEQNKEATENIDDETKPSEDDPSAAETKIEPKVKQEGKMTDIAQQNKGLRQIWSSFVYNSRNRPRLCEHRV